MTKDLYAVLGLSKNASVADVKAAYRKLSKEWHPDKHKGDKKAEERFKEINQAYEVLGDETKKKQYDQFGTTGGPGGGFGGGQGFGGFDFSGQGFGDLGDIFESFFGGRGGRRQTDRGDDRQAAIRVTLEDVLHGMEREITIDGLVRCATCDGKGAAAGTDLETCDTCNGTGQVTRVAQSFFGAVQQRSVCTRCGGSGKIPKTPCKTCDGEGRVKQKRTLTIRIPAGIEDGQALRVENEGDAGRRGGKSGDLILHVRVEPDPRFERDGADIHGRLTVDALDAILGATMTVPTVHGETTISIDAGTQPGQVLRIKGKGVPTLQHHRAGDHYVHVEIAIPKKLSRQERKILEEWKNSRN